MSATGEHTTGPRNARSTPKRKLSLLWEIGAGDVPIVWLCEWTLVVGSQIPTIFTKSARKKNAIREKLQRA